MNSPGQRLPVSVITGFLGSGKTTLINHLVNHPAMGEAAVIVNEFGEIGLDHTLIERSDEHTILLGTGCLCCTVRGDLVNTLGDLSVRRLKGQVAPFKRLVIETTGLADPAPILHTLMSVPVVARFCLDTVITTVDAVNGSATLDHHQEAVKQAAVADRLVVTKTDLAGPATIEPLLERLGSLNPAATAIPAIDGNIDPEVLFGSLKFNLETKTEDVRQWLNDEAYANPHTDHDHPAIDPDVNRHDEHIRSFCLTFEQPLKWNELAAWLDTLAAREGERLLRVKGLVNVEGIDEPVVIHAVQHLFHPPSRIAAWPDEDRRSRIVFITRDLDRRKIEETLSRLQAALAGPAEDNSQPIKRNVE